MGVLSNDATLGYFGKKNGQRVNSETVLSSRRTTQSTTGTALELSLYAYSEGSPNRHQTTKETPCTLNLLLLLFLYPILRT